MTGYEDEDDRPEQLKESQNEPNAAPETEQKSSLEMRFSDTPMVISRRAPVTAPLRPEDAPDIPIYDERQTTDDIGPSDDTPMSVEEWPVAVAAADAPTGEAVGVPVAEVQPPFGTSAPDEDALPEAAPGADLPQPQLHTGWKALVLLVTLGIYLAFLNQQIIYNSPPTGDQPFYLMVTMSIVQDGDLNLANNYANHDEDKFYGLAPHPSNYVGIAAPYPLPPHNGYTPARPPEEQYNFHLPGLSILLIPAWLIGGLFQLWWPATLVFMCIVGALTVLNAFLLAYEVTGKRWVALAVWVPIAFSNPIMTYSYMIFTELTCGLLLIYAFRRLALGWGANEPFRRVLIGLCIGATPWIAWRCVPIVAGLLVYAAVQWWRHYRLTRNDLDAETGRVVPTGTEYLQPSDVAASDTRNLMWGTLWLLVPVGVLGVLLAWHNLFLYGSLSQTSRSNELGDQSLFLWPWQGREALSHFAASIYGLLFDQKFGLLTYAPIYLLAIVGLLFMFRSARKSDRRLLLWMGVVSLPYLFVIFSFFYWNGLWCPPARFLTTFCPLLAAPLAMTLVAANNWIYKAIYGLFTIPGFIFMGAMIADPRNMWPGNSVMDWLAGRDPYAKPPLLGTPIDLNNVLPAVDPLDARTLPNTTFWMSVFVIAVLVVVFVLGLRWQREQRTYGHKPLPYAIQGVAWVVGLSLLSGTWYLANFEYIQHKTQITEVGRWTASVPLEAPHGIAYLDGKVYVADFNTSTIVAFDTATGESRIIANAETTGGVLLHPGNIAVGNDGKLYVLNNGVDAFQAILVISPDGQIERTIQLNNKTTLAIGLDIADDGRIIISDMSGRRVQVYGAEGGPIVADYQGHREIGFDNGSGVAIGPDGTIYAAEMTFKDIQVINSSGQYVKDFELKCAPWFMALTGEWLDVTCPEGGINSINLNSGSIQTAYSTSGVYPIAPTGLTYAPDGTLYVIDRNVLIAYKVEH